MRSQVPGYLWAMYTTLWSSVASPPAQPASNRPGGNLKWDLTMQCTSQQLHTTRNYPTGCTSKSCLNLPAKRIRPPAEPVQKSPRRFRINSLLTRTLATGRGKDDTATFPCLPPLCCGCQVSDDYCTGMRWVWWAPLVEGPLFSLQLDKMNQSQSSQARWVWSTCGLTKLSKRSPARPPPIAWDLPACLPVFADLGSGQLNCMSPMRRNCEPWSLCSISQTGVNRARNASCRRGE